VSDDDNKTRILTAEDAARWSGLTESAEKTRVLTAEDAAQILGKPGDGGADREPRFDGKKIVFFCSNGHRITVDVSLAGKAGKCSKQGCGVPVQIPSPPGAEQAATSARPAKPPRPAAEPPPVVAPEIVIAQPTAEPAVEGPDTLVVDAPARPPAPPVAPPAGDEPSFDFIPGGSPTDAAAPAGTVGAEAEAWTFDLDQIDHPTARLVARLWQERAHGGVVEVHLSGGGVIMPEWYDPQWSCGTHAVFAALAADGTVTLTAVAWDQIQKVVVRQVQGTPDGMFEA